MLGKRGLMGLDGSSDLAELDVGTLIGDRAHNENRHAR